MTTEMQSLYTPNTSAHMSHTSAAVDGLVSKYSSTVNANTAAAFRSQRARVPFECFLDRVRLEYYRYEVTFGLYVMTPSEKLVANTFVFVVLTLLLWALLLYFPSLLYHKLSRLVWLLTGHSNREVGTALGILDNYGNPISTTSIAEHAVPS
ncbi:uncharacterized protein N7482_006664 [Penicillium canariense]|uniref:Uncharacterized protein n=1 Tax=Penicillium canariense TaxID=189055 RepID=A0A9W9HXR2_9EURO|nr:uncharacterized protein N7482_006664 [Penicillium canariense]KAJ5159660.1 hypothetical protein N7482_006664 [Penicillium canariense]